MIKQITSLMLLLLVSIATFNSYASVYIVGSAPFGGWNPSSGMEMTTDNDVTFTATNVELSGTVYFIFTTALGEWSDVNSHRYGPTDGDQAVTVDTPVATQISTNDAASYYVNASGTYNITFNIESLTFTIVTVNSSEPDDPDPDGTQMWILGNAFGGSFDPSTGVKMKTTDHNVFTATIEMPASENRFSFTTMLSETGNWDEIKSYRYGSPSSSYNINSMLGTEIPLKKSTSSFLVGQGTYVVTVTLDAMTLKVEKDGEPVEIADVWVMGEVNGNKWAPNVGVKMETTNGILYNATITTDGANEGYSYFSFTKKLAETATEDDWNLIADYRFGAKSDGDFLVGQKYLNKPLSLTTDNPQAFQLEAGEYGLQVNLSEMTLVISGHALDITDADRAKCFIDDPENKQVTFIFDPKLWNYNGTISTAYVRGSFTGWGNYDYCKMLYDPDGFYYLTLSYEQVKIPGNSGQPEFKFYINGSYPGGDKSFVPEGYIFMNGDQNHIVVFSDDDFEQIKANSKIANYVRPLSEFDLTTEDGQMEVSNFRRVPGTRHLYRCYHPFKVSRAGYASELPRMQYVQELSAKYGIKSDIVLSGDETGSLTTVTINGQSYKEFIPEYYQAIIDRNSVLYVGQNNSTPSYNVVYYSPESSKFGIWMKEVAEFIADDNNRAPFSIHCRLGTDRTGVFSAMLAAICGATWQEIAADYQLTNRLGIKEFRDYHLLQYSMQRMLGVENINEVENLSEAVCNYFISNNYITAEQIEIIRKKLIGSVGDVNLDNTVNTGDVSAIYRYILTGNSAGLFYGDINNDKLLNVGDVGILYKIILGSEQ